MSRRWDTIGIGLGLVVTFIVLVVLGTIRPDGGPPAIRPDSGPRTVPGTSVPQGAASPAAWMRKLVPGERPPQFVLFSFDGAGSHQHWQRFLRVASDVDAHFSAFLSGIYLLTDSQKTDYTGPGHRPGRATITFGGSEENVRALVGDLNTAVADGHEIGTHYNGHFCRGAEPSVGRWDTAQWTSELDQFFTFLDRAEALGLRIDRDAVKGGRTPCLEGRFDQLAPALTARGMTYDSSQVTDGMAWPTRRDGLWEFPLPSVRVPAAGFRHAIMMDYNFWFLLSRGKDEPARAEEFARITLETYQRAYQAAYNGNRAPMVVGNHFNDWSGGAFMTATERFMGEVCVRAETVCATHSEVVDWLALQDPAVLAAYRALPNAQITE
ncbi:polysaccharide deacetylase family protein [Actinokineospora iranica]|uniref:Polysaccharide deacetylase n=1 Tax=Actinokineospora iranica TaxID=1271860 RepID=A0A1G6REJ0_9PSEU|nr:polysaccharide deacetylase [Actinokineospora iranica]SDD02447.1 hypothetical protein SAMN05216174_106283 [Actinokineospora iranica]